MFLRIKFTFKKQNFVRNNVQDWVLIFKLRLTSEQGWGSTVEDLLGAYSINDVIWGGTNLCDVSVDTANSKEVMAGSHIMEQHIFKFRGSDQHEHLNMTTYNPCKDDLSWNQNLDFLDNFHNWNILSKMNDATNNRANTTETTIANQEHQDYYDQRD